MDFKCDGVIVHNILVSTLTGGPISHTAEVSRCDGLDQRVWRPFCLCDHDCKSRLVQDFSISWRQAESWEPKSFDISSLTPQMSQTPLEMHQENALWYMCLILSYSKIPRFGILHVHMGLILDKSSIPGTGDNIDILISSGLPFPDSKPQLHSAVTQCMLHEPYKSHQFWLGSEWCLGYSHVLIDEAQKIEDSYSTYKNLNNGWVVLKNTQTYHDGHVVPHNLFLLFKYNCHINIKIVLRTMAIK